MIESFDIQLVGSLGRPFLIDASMIRDKSPKPVVIFCHGFKGFKDWGCFNLVAEKFAEAGIVFLKMNFSHNGTTIENKTEFDDLKAFGMNNFTKELFDLKKTIDYLAESEFADELDLERVNLIGHSKGGSAVLLKAVEDRRIKRVVTWSSISNLEWLVPNDHLEQWEKDGVRYILNGRTKQMMPLYWQLCQDYFQNKTRLHMPTMLQQLAIPHLIIHGDNDTSVPLDIAFELKRFSPRAEMVVIQGGDHTCLKISLRL